MNITKERQSIDIYTITLDDFGKEMVLQSLMERAHTKGLPIEVKNKILQLYYDIKEDIILNKKISIIK